MERITQISTESSIYDTSMSVNGFFTVDAKLISFNGDISEQITSYNFSNGVKTYSDADPEGHVQFLVNTDSNGNITNWIVDIFDVYSLSTNIKPGDIISRIISNNEADQTELYQCDFVVGSCVFSKIDGATNQSPGGWSVSATNITPILYLLLF